MDIDCEMAKNKIQRGWRIVRLFSKPPIIKRAMLRFIKNPYVLVNMLGVMTVNKYFNRGTFLPFSLDIELTTKCNLTCTYCRVNKEGWQERAKLENMKFEDFKKIIDDTKNHLFIIKLQGMGETLLNKDVFRMVEYATSKGILVYTFTNATLVNDNNVHKILNCGLIALNISLDGGTRDTYNAVRVNADFDKVLANIKKITSNKKNKLPLINVWTVGTKENIKEVPNLINICSESGVNSLTIQLKFTTWNRAEFKKLAEDVRLDENEIKDFIDDCYKLAHEKGLNFDFFNRTFTKKSPCYWPTTSFYISNERAIVPCCTIGEPEVLNFGNLKDNSIAKIWRSDAYQSFRKIIKEHKLPDYCKNCYGEFD